MISRSFQQLFPGPENVSGPHRQDQSPGWAKEASVSVTFSRLEQ